MQTENVQSLPQKKSEFYRFKLMQGNVNHEGKFEKTKTVGMAYFVDGSKSYTLKLWTLLKDKFYLAPRKHDQSSFFVLTKEQTKNPEARHRSFSNIVGNARVFPEMGVIKIEFDLLDKPIYMSIYPEPSAQSARLQAPDAMNEAA